MDHLVARRGSNESSMSSITTHESVVDHEEVTGYVRCIWAYAEHGPVQAGSNTHDSYYLRLHSGVGIRVSPLAQWPND